MHDLQVPFGFSTNWSNIVKEDSRDLKNMKSHYYHILMQHLLPILIQHVFKDWKEIQKIIRSFCMFFNALCSKVIDLETLVALERSMAKQLCKMEKIFPPSIFVIMMHLPIHLAYEIHVCGPVRYRWMYPFERYILSIIKYLILYFQFMSIFILLIKYIPS